MKEMHECGGEHKIYILLSGMKQTEQHKGVTQKSTTSGLFFSGFGADLSDFREMCGGYWRTISNN